MGIYTNVPDPGGVDAEHLLLTMLEADLPDGVSVTFAPEAEELDFAKLENSSFPMVIVALIEGSDLNGSDTFKDGEVWDIGILCLDVNRQDEPSSHANASMLARVVQDRLKAMAKRQAGVPGVGSIHTVKNVARPRRSFTVTAGNRQRTQFEALYEITLRPRPVR